MFIVWGYEGKEKVTARGRFFCPECCEERDYVHKRIDRYFTLYWIPIFKTDTLGELIECRHCHSQFKKEVLEYRPPSEQDLFLQSVHHDMATGTPLQAVYRKLLNSGVALEIAGRVVWATCGDNVRVCQVQHGLPH